MLGALPPGALMACWASGTSPLACATCIQVMPHIASMGIYVVKADVMRKLLMSAYPSANDFGSEIIPGAVDLGMRVQAYLYEGYCA